MQVVYDCDSRRISGPSLLEVTCHQHLDGALQDMARMRPKALMRQRAIHKCHSAIHQWRSCLSQMLLQNIQKCYIFLLIVDFTGGCYSVTYVFRKLSSSQC